MEENHREEIIEAKGNWEASGRHLASIWQASARHLAGICEASGRHLGVQEAMGLQEAPSHRKRCPSQLKCESSIEMCISHYAFEAKITK